MTHAPRAGLLTAPLGLREKVDHFLIHCQNLGGTMTLEDYRTNFPQSCSHPNSLEPWCRGHRAGWEQLLRGVAGVPEPSLPSGRAEADGAHGALGDLPQQAHVVHPAPGQCASFPALDDGGGRCARTPGPHPHLHGDTDHCVRGRGGPGAEEVGRSGVVGLAASWGGPWAWGMVSLWCSERISLLPPPLARWHLTVLRTCWQHALSVRDPHMCLILVKPQ